MNQIICDICGSEFAETLEACPVCGYPRQGTEKNAAVAGEVVRTRVKGGRFSSKNVKKRRKAQRKAAREKERSNKPLVIVIVLLLVAIALVSLYIFMRFFQGSGAPHIGRDTSPTTTAPAVTTTAPAVACEGILLEEAVIALDAPGQTQKLALTLLPKGTTDALVFATSNSGVVTVSEDGTLTAVGSGQASVTITCGAVVKECTVMCWFAEETTAPAETTVPPETAAPTEAPKPTEAPVLTLDPNDASCFSIQDMFTLYARLGSSTVGRSKVTWTTSDSKVATVENGIVTPVGKGTATITAEYEGQKATCVVRCRFEDPADQGSSQEPADQTWRASHSDVSISVGESFRLSVKNADGKTADAIWTMSLDGIISIEGKTITGRAPGTVTLTTTVEGQTFTCIIRVK